MAKYKFNNYVTHAGVLDGEFTNPTIEVNRKTIVTNDDDKTISCDIVLIGSDYRVATQFIDMPRNGTGWDDSDLETMIGIELQKFLVVE